MSHAPLSTSHAAWDADAIHGVHAMHSVSKLRTARGVQAHDGAAIGHGVAFQTWQSLVHQGVTDSEAAQLIIRLITTAEHDASRGAPGAKRAMTC
jgi:hypothetical protein